MSDDSTRDDRFVLHRDAIEVTSVDDQGTDLDYWRQRPPEERLAAVEFLRQLNYGYDPTTARLSRVLEITRRS